jgi:hypothetical protein
VVSNEMGQVGIWQEVVVAYLNTSRYSPVSTEETTSLERHHYTVPLVSGFIKVWVRDGEFFRCLLPNLHPKLTFLECCQPPR